MSQVKIGDWTFDHLVYDEEHDVLYLSIGAPRLGYGEETAEGHILRYDENDDFCGVTLVGIQGLLDKNEAILVSLPPPPKPVKLHRTEINRALATC